MWEKRGVITCSLNPPKYSSFTPQLFCMFLCSVQDKYKIFTYMKEKHT